MSKKKILLMVPLPPPVHGSNLMNQCVVNCGQLHDIYIVRVLPLHYVSDVADIGTINFKKLIAFVGYLTRLLMLMITFRPDAVYFSPSITGVSFYRDCVYAFVFKFFGIRIMHHLHAKGVKSKLSNSFLLKFYRWFFKGATVIHLSPLLYEDIREVVPFEQCRFLPNGIEDLEQNYLNKACSFERIPIILFISNLIPSKGPMVLLDACRHLKNRGIEFKSYFVGNPSSELTAEAFIDSINCLDLHKDVEYLGPRYGVEKYKIIMKSDIFVFPTFYEKEAFPLVLLEAMAAGLPTVSTREGAISEIIDDGLTGFVVDRQNPCQLADTIECLIASPDKMKKMGQAGRKKFEQNYTIEKFYHNLMNIFYDVLAE